MKIEEYDKQALTTLTSKHSYGDIDAEMMAQVLGLVGEGGEFAEKIKKIIRDNQGELSSEDKLALLSELGDVLWYVNSLANLLDSSLEDLARMNLEKVLSRKDRNKINGNGDDR